MFAGKTVIVTGSSNGIGAQAAIEFAKQGANVILHGRNRDSLAQVENACISTGAVKKDQIASVIGDICNVQVQKELIDSAIGKFGKISVLVNNAGMGKWTPIPDDDGHFDMDTFDMIMNVNFRAVVSLTMKCLPHLKATKGTIVNVSSVASSRPAKTVMAYCISKTALDGFTKTLAAELASYGVRVNSVNPGPIPTNIDRDMKKSKTIDDIDRALSVPMKRQGTTMETSNAILFLASDQSSYTTGNILMVDGGLCISPLM